MSVLASRRTFLHYVMDVLREVQGQANQGEAAQAVQSAVKIIDQKGNWEFLLAEANLSVVGPYSTGTISGVGGSALITGVGSAWSTGWQFRTLSLSGRLDYPISSFVSPTVLGLANPLSGSVSFSASAYTIYAGRYLLPNDCEPGRDIVLKGASQFGWNGEIRKMPRALHERRKYEFAQTGGPRWYTDAELDETTNRPTILLYPYPHADGELRLLYYRSFSVPNTYSSLIPIPAAFEELIVLKAAAILMQRKKMQQWLEKENTANAMLTDLYNRYAASAAYDYSIEADDSFDGMAGGSTFQDSVFFTRGGRY